MRSFATISAALAGLILAGCAAGPSDETLVDRLRVMAIQADPPEANPGQQVTLTATVADPAGEGVELLLWHCTDLGEGCLEEGTEHAWSLDPVDGQATVTATVPEALAPFASEEPVRATLLWTLACAPGVCPQIGAPEAYDLADPVTWLEELPVEGVSLAFGALAISSREDGLLNPVLTPPDPADLAAAPGESLTLDFGVELSTEPSAETLAFGYASAGGFGETEYAIGDDGAVSLEWYAPDEPGTADLWVIVHDGAGGVGLWTGRVLVED